MSDEPKGDELEIYKAKVYIYSTNQYVLVPPWVIDSLNLEHGDEVEIVIRKVVEEEEEAPLAR